MYFFNSKKQVKAYFLIIAFITFSCFFNFYKTSFAAHHCDHEDHCVICTALHLINDESPTPLGANLNNTVLIFAISIFLYTVCIYKKTLIRATPVSNRVKKTE
ncbi:hypothetical protein [uncultured Succinivibrio sp.]|uniref:hypothetical protein n=1 Tax=uncultured Succinivibrio sp. TaxID=540749 RepID=UPI0025EEDC32|nr:hypothetical protein [uncultured Succinivibrio sp.]